MSAPNPAVDFYFTKSKNWGPEQRLMRQIALGMGLAEDLKWGHPCYTLNGANIVLIHAFKDYCAYLFHKGVLMPDPDAILIQQTPNVQSARQIRMTDLAQIKAMEPLLKAYIAAAIAVEKSGLKVAYKATEDFFLPQELVNAMDANPDFAAAFHALTPGRQRGYCLHFSQPKQSKTRSERIAKFSDAIFAGKGFQDR